MSVYRNDRLAWVKEAILSILEAAVLPGEILIYCDGKIDVSIQNLLFKFKKELPKKFSLYKSDINKGRAFSRQFMLKKARGKFILLMDADDISLPNRLELQYDFIINNPDTDLIGGYIIEFSNQFKDRLRKVPL